MTVMIDVQNLSKQFTLHNQGGASFTVLDNVNFNVSRGECVALHGTSGSGKSTLMRSLYANYKPQTGAIWVHNEREMIDIANAEPRQVMRLREHTIGYVSQFLRVIPRVSTLDVVMEPVRMKGAGRDEAESRAAALLMRLNVPERLWSLAPSTFSGGEQQRVNIARGFISDYPILLLDEPTASLDNRNRDVVVEMINEAKDKGTALVGIFHDEEVRSAVADRLIDLTIGSGSDFESGKE